MRCNQAIALFSRHREGDLPPALRSQVEQHLAACSRCREEFAALDAICAALRELTPEAVPAQLAARVRARLETRAERPRAVLLRWAIPVGAAAALAIVVFGVLRPVLTRPPAAVRSLQLRATVGEPRISQAPAAMPGKAPRPVVPTPGPPAARAPGAPAAPGPAALSAPGAHPPAALQLAETRREAEPEEHALSLHRPAERAGAAPPGQVPRDALEKRLAARAPITQVEREYTRAPAEAPPAEQPAVPAPTTPPDKRETAAQAPAEPPVLAIEPTPQATRAPEEGYFDRVAAGRAAKPQSVVLSAQASRAQQAAGSLTLHVTAPQPVEDARISLRSSDGRPRETTLWQGRLEPTRPSTVDVHLGPVGAETGPQTRQLIVSGQALPPQTYYVIPPAQPAPLARVQRGAPRGHFRKIEKGGEAPQTWGDVLQALASNRGVYILAPAQFPLDAQATAGARGSDQALNQALERMGYRLRVQPGVWTIDSEQGKAPARTGRGRAR